MNQQLFALLTAASLCGAATAQICSDNVYPVRIVDAAGNVLPTTFDPVANENTFLVPTETVYLAFDPNIPSGTYYVHITDTPIDGMDEVLSTNDPMDRFVQVDNNNGVITLSLPMSGNPVATGAGLNGVGESLCLTEYSASQFSQCNFKLWFGNNYDLGNGPNNPYLLAGGLLPNSTECAIRSYHSFRVGDGDGGDVCGLVFEDLDGDGMQDAGEPGLAGWTVSLVDAMGSSPTVTDVDGNYCFENVPAGNYTVELTVQAGYTATTSTSFVIDACACASKPGGDFGVRIETVFNCNARTPGYWRNKHGRALVQQFGILAMLPSLCIVDEAGTYVAPASIQEYKQWLKGANATNMAYMLSAHVVAMHNNITVGYVDPNCMVVDPELGTVAIGDVLQMAVMSLCDHPFTPVGSPQRAHQEELKNALDRANNNSTWL